MYGKGQNPKHPYFRKLGQGVGGLMNQLFQHEVVGNSTGFSLRSEQVAGIVCAHCRTGQSLTADHQLLQGGAVTVKQFVEALFEKKAI
jgi:hypothetical protein